MSDHEHEYSDDTADAEYYIPKILNTQSEAIKALKEIRNLAKKAFKSGNYVLHSALHQAAEPLCYLGEKECYDEVLSLSKHLKKEDRDGAEEDTLAFKHEAERIFDEILVESNTLELEINYEE